MGIFHALWVDDDWKENAEIEKRIILDKAFRFIDNKLKNLVNSHVKWVFSESVEKAVGKIGTSGIDFRIVIIDYEFQNDDAKWFALVNSLRERNVPYIVFTRWIYQFKHDNHFDEKDLLCKGIFDKKEENLNRISDVLYNFFLAPPFRILHLSDLHYDSTLIDANARDQQALFTSLCQKIKQENEKQLFDSIIITGDFASCNPGRDLRAVVDIIEEIVDSTIKRNNLDRLYLIPGNHDILWSDFSNKILDRFPWYPFLDFYRTIYSDRQDILQSLQAFRSGKKLSASEFLSSDLLWYRHSNDPSLEAVGLVTIPKEKDRQGEGIFSFELEDFVKKQWKRRNPSFGEIRIALMHHNLFATLSVHSQDEKKVLSNPGDAMLTLTECRCNIVLSGHTHSPNIFSCLSAGMEFGECILKNIVVISAGTTGGKHKAGDRQKSFNILDFHEVNQSTGCRSLSIKNFIYKSSHHEWDNQGKECFLEKV